MNIFIECHYFDDGFHGARTYVKGLYQSMILRYNDNFFLGSLYPEKLEKEFGQHDNVHYIRYKNSNKYLRMLYEIPQIIKLYHIDYAHYQYFVPFLKKCKEIVTIHDVLFLDFPEFFPSKYKILFNRLFKIAAKRADILLTVSEYSKKRISYYYNIPLNNILVTPNAVVKTSNSEDATINHIVEGNFILYVGRIEKRKNHLTLVKAFEQSKIWRNGYSLVMAGRCTFRVNELDDYISNLPQDVKDKVIFCEPSDKELNSLYKKCNLFVFPSMAEGFGIPPLEAGIAGKKVLCSNSTAMKEFASLGFEMFDPYNVNQLAELIAKNITTPVADELLEQIKNNIETKYNWDKIAMQLHEKIMN